MSATNEPYEVGWGLRREAANRLSPSTRHVGGSGAAAENYVNVPKISCLDEEFFDR